MGNSAKQKLIGESLENHDLASLFEKYDPTKSGQLDKKVALSFLSDFISVVVEKFSPEQTKNGQKLKKSIIDALADDYFHSLDADGNGCLDQKEFEDFISKHEDAETIKAFVKRAWHLIGCIEALYSHCKKGEWTEMRTHVEKYMYAGLLKTTYPPICYDGTPYVRFGCYLSVDRSCYEYTDLKTGKKCVYINANDEIIKKYGSCIPWTVSHLVCASSFDWWSSDEDGDKMMGLKVALRGEGLTMIPLMTLDKVGNSFLDVARLFGPPGVVEFYWKDVLAKYLDHMTHSSTKTHGLDAKNHSITLKEREHHLPFMYDIPEVRPRTNRLVGETCEEKRRFNLVWGKDTDSTDIRPPNSTLENGGIVCFITEDRKKGFKTIHEYTKQLISLLAKQGTIQDEKQSKVMLFDGKLECELMEWTWLPDIKVNFEARRLWQVGWKDERGVIYSLRTTAPATKTDANPLEKEYEELLKKMSLNIWMYDHEIDIKRQVDHLLSVEPICPEMLYCERIPRYIINVIGLKNGGNIKTSLEAWEKWVKTTGLEWLQVVSKMEAKKASKSDIESKNKEYDDKIRGSFVLATPGRH